MKDAKLTNIIPKENIYGHTKRLLWILSNIKKNDTIIELGCGTGCMITLPLAKLGYSIVGIDTDKSSIEFGQRVFSQEGISPEILKVSNIEKLDINPDIIIASEVFEHMPDKDLGVTLTKIYNKLIPRGKLLVTVPNGYGWFELESFLWFKVGIGKLLEWTQVTRVVNKIKHVIVGTDFESPYSSTLSASYHVQRFTFKSIQELLQKHHFKVVAVSGSVLFAGPFSNLLFTGIQPIMQLNCSLVKWFPRLASGFFVECLVDTEGSFPHSEN
ncbi:MAG: hypothetical protein JETT_1917 [Candidatus Jettenia ecosi]|uniref:Uncharacterized protein n=1 Tax=Candidatus Jettenia ecosi TaxID=2494326 RepID=A0A533QAV1_9BACT|nr:MAG: hypothetical protein JETT_1917 [Candidatus Jettenia ecosi]